jgi:very-short-patch-repair endonuclease
MWTPEQLRKLLSEGRIRGFKINKAAVKDPKGKIVAKLFKKKSKEKTWMSETLLTWCNERALVLQEEYQFHPERKWRFDWCIESLKVAIEYEGIYSKQSRHTNRKGYSKDAEKYNAAASLGWRVYRYTSLTYKNLEKDLQECV